MLRSLQSFAVFVIVLSILFFNISTLLAIAFPFRQFGKGDQVPDVTVQGFADPGKTVSFSELKGNGFVAVFWGADLPEKIEHSAKVLKEVESLAPFLQERNIRILLVNAQGDDAANIEEVIKQAGGGIDVFLDRENKAYATLGLFVLPSVLVVDKDGRVAAGLGYSHDLKERLKGEIEIMLGEKTPDQVEAELRPEMKEATAEEKASRRHLDFGLVMLERGQPDAAVRELKKAVEIDPGLALAHLRLGCIYLSQDRLEQAEASLNKAPESDPASLLTHCRGELKRKKGQFAEAEKELKAILEASPANHNAAYTLGKVYEDQQRLQEAAAAYKKAYRLIRQFSASEE